MKLNRMMDPLSNRVSAATGTNILHSSNNMVMHPSPTNWYNQKKQLQESASRRNKHELTDSTLERRFHGDAPQFNPLSIDVQTR